MLSRVFFVLAAGWLSISLAGAHDLSEAPQKPTGAEPPQTLQTIDLGKEIPGLGGRQLRMRKLVLKPGGAIPPHAHTDRPAIVYILQGRVREHRSDRDKPMEYGAGDSIAEHAGTHHWIESIGKEPLIGIVVDITNFKGVPAFSAEQVLGAYGVMKHVHE